MARVAYLPLMPFFAMPSLSIHKNRTHLQLSLFWSLMALTVPLLCQGCAAPHKNVRSSELPPPDTTLGPGDVLDIRVLEESLDELSFRVAQDGSIDYPYLGRVTVAGLEPTEVSDLIQRKLLEGGFLKNPVVSVFVREYNSKRISVVGAVKSPGAFPITPGLTVVQVISLAGGFTNLANKDAAVLVRRNGNTITRIPIRLDEISNGNAEDIPVRAGDILNVPERLF